MYEAGSDCVQTKDLELSCDYKSRMYNRDTSAFLNHYHPSNMGLPLPEKLRGTCATLGALSIFTFILRCYVRIRLVKSWGLDDTFISMAFVSLSPFSTTYIDVLTTP
jgi:hypothetical protein